MCLHLTLTHSTCVPAAIGHVSAVTWSYRCKLTTPLVNHRQLFHLGFLANPAFTQINNNQSQTESSNTFCIFSVYLLSVPGSSQCRTKITYYLISFTQEGFRESPLLLYIKTSQCRRLRYLVRTPPGLLFGELFWTRPTRRRPRGRPQTHLEGWCFLTGLETPWDSPRGAGPSGWREGKESLRLSATGCYPAARSQINEKQWTGGCWNTIVYIVNISFF